MQKVDELNDDELDCVSAGAVNEGGSSLSDLVKLILSTLHIPSKPGGPIRS